MTQLNPVDYKMFFGNNPNDPLVGYSLWLNPTYRTNSVFQDSARTVPAIVGNPIGGVYDQVNNITATASGANRPTRTANGMTFNGSQWLTHTNVALSNYTLYVVAFKTNPATLRYPIGGTPAAGLYFNQGVGFFDGTVSPGGVGTTGLWISVVTNTGFVYRNDTEIVNNGGNFAAITLTTIGQRGDANFHFDDEIREILYYPTTHSIGTRNAEVAKAALRCGVTV